MLYFYFTKAQLLNNQTSTEKDKGGEDVVPTSDSPSMQQIFFSLPS